MATSAKMKYMKAVIFLLLIGSGVCGEKKDEDRKGHYFKRLLSSFKSWIEYIQISNTEGHIRTKRSDMNYSCTNAIDCTPDHLKSVSIPQKFINCEVSSGSCVCSDCFVLYNNSCQINVCWNWTDSGHCVDDRRSQKTTVLLSAFLSSTGAANFYIGQYLLGAVQLVLLLLVIVLSCTMIFFPCCVLECCNDDDDDDDDNVLRYCCALLCCVLSALGVVLILLVIIFWWIADLVVFLQNSRPDNNGCPLYEDL